MIRAALILALLRGVAALVLGFAIIGGCGVSIKSANAKALTSFPTESDIVPILHEIKIGQRTEEPERLGISSHSIIQVRHNFGRAIIETQFRGAIRVRFENFSDREGLGESVRWSVGQFVADKPSALNFNRECFRPAEIRENEIIDCHEMDSRFIALLRITKAEAYRLNANNRQFNRDSSSGAEIGSTGGNARRSCYTDCETSEYRGENRNDESGKSGDFILIGMNEVTDWSENRAYHGGAVFIGGAALFVALAGLYLCVTR